MLCATNIIQACSVALMYVYSHTPIFIHRLGMGPDMMNEPRVPRKVRCHHSDFRFLLGSWEKNEVCHQRLETEDVEARYGNAHNGKAILWPIAPPP